MIWLVLRTTAHRLRLVQVFLDDTARICLVQEALCDELPLCELVHEHCLSIESLG